MSAGVYNFEIEQGTTTTIVLTIRDQASALVNLTGYTATMNIGSSVTLTSSDGITLGGAAGTVTITITPTVSRQIHGNTKYELDLTSGAATTRPVKGRIRVRAEVAA